MYGFDGGMYGFSASECDELLMQGVKPWDEDAGDVLAALADGYSEDDSYGGDCDEVEEDEEHGVCNVCGVECESACGKCHLVYYCSKEHQRIDWEVHKKNCAGISGLGLGDDPSAGNVLKKSV